MTFRKRYNHCGLNAAGENVLINAADS